MAHPAHVLIQAGFELSLGSSGLVSVVPASRLTDEQRQFIRAHRDEIAQWLAHSPPPVGAVNPAHGMSHDDWRALHDLYQAHHVGCAVCIAAGKGYGLRCGTGAALWVEYSQATAPPRRRATKPGSAE